MILSFALNCKPFLSARVIARWMAAIVVALCAAHPPAHAETAARGDPAQTVFDSIFATAVTQLTQGRPVAAQVSLRRAYRHAQTPAHHALLREAFRIAAQDSPLTLTFGASIAPSSNINGGAMDEYFYLGDYRFAFGPSSRALSGIEYTANAKLRYRLGKTARGSTSFGINLYGRSYSLSAQSQALVPTASGRDYALGSAEISLRHVATWAQSPNINTFELHLGRVSYGGDPLYAYQKISLGHEVPLSMRQRLVLMGSAEWQHSNSTARADAKVIDVSATYQTSRSDGTQWTLTAAARSNASDLQTDTFNDVTLSATYGPAWQMLRAKPVFSVSFGHKTYDEFILSLDGRRDSYGSLGLSLMFQDIAWFGFSPVLSLSQRRTLSNVARYDTAEMRVNLALQSRF